MEVLEAIKAMEQGKEVLVNGEKTFTGTGREFLKANFEVVDEGKFKVIKD